MKTVQSHKLALTLAEFSSQLSDCHDEEEVLWFAVSAVGELGFEDCVIYQYDDGTNKLVQVAAFGEKSPINSTIKNPIEIPIGHGITGHVAMIKQGMIVDDVRLEPRYIEDLRELRSEITVPIIVGNHVFGVIDCESKRKEAFNDVDLAMLDTIANMISLRVGYLQLYTLQSASKIELINECERLRTELDKSIIDRRYLSHAQAMEKIGQLSGGVAHDFNNQLAVMQSSIDVLKLEEKDQNGELDFIQGAIDRCGELTQSLLAFSSQQILFPDCVNLSDTVLKMKELLSRIMGAWIDIETKIDSGLWNVNADLGQLENALLNLAINARDAMQEGGKLTISCYNALLSSEMFPDNINLEAGPYVIVSVTDCGAGMSENVLSHAFEPYFTTKGLGDGSGLGLSMVYGFARQSLGDVMITTALGEGTTVKLFLPKAKDNQNTKAHLAESPNLISGNGRHVLVIEDNLQLKETLGKLLALLGFLPILAESAEEAREKCLEAPRIDLILSDIILDNGNKGPPLCKELKSMHPNSLCAFMTGFLDAKSGADDKQISNGKVLGKPFTFRELSHFLEVIFSYREQNILTNATSSL